MSMGDLFLLYKLHQVDWSIYQIRQKASKVGVYPQLMQKYKEIQTQATPVILKSQELEKKYLEITLKQQNLQERLKTIEKEIYTTGVTAREVETLQKEIKNIHHQTEENDLILLQILEDLPETQQKADEAKKPLLEIEKQIEEQKKLSLNLKESLQKEFEKLQALRPQIAQQVPSHLLNEYKLLLKKLDGIAMTEITPQKTCQMCGTHIAERLLEMCKNGKKVQCESCQRIFYFPPIDLK